MTERPTVAHERGLPVAEGLSLLAMLMVVWLPAFPLGTDLPQHAEQIRLISDLLGDGPWRNELTLVPLTPYWLTYGAGALLLPLAGMGGTVKLLVSAGLLLLLTGSRALLSAHGRDPQLALFALLGGLGFCHQWGFLPFTLSIGMTLHLLAHAQRRAVHRPAALPAWPGLALASAILLTHGLGAMIAAGLLIAQAWSHERRARPASLILAILLMAAILLWSRTMEAGVAGMSSGLHFGLSPTRSAYDFYTETATSSFWAWGRLTGWFPRVFGLGQGLAATIAGLAFCLAPLLSGYRLRRGTGLPLFAALCLAMLAAPTYMNGTVFISERLSLLFFCLFPLVLAGRPAGLTRLRLCLAAGIVMIAGIHLASQSEYIRHMSDLKALVLEQPAQQRMLYMAARERSPGLVAPRYLHAGHWYGALQHGLVDPSFASTQLQPVRYREAMRPAVDLGTRLHWQDGHYRWQDIEGDRYALFLAMAPETSWLERATGCRIAVAETVSRGNWTTWRKPAGQPCRSEQATK